MRYVDLELAWPLGRCYMPVTGPRLGPSVVCNGWPFAARAVVPGRRAGHCAGQRPDVKAGAGTKRGLSGPSPPAGGRLASPHGAMAGHCLSSNPRRVLALRVTGINCVRYNPIISIYSLS